MIRDYKFGKIVVGGKSFSNDVEVDWQGNVEGWWRKEGHEVHLEDLKRALDKSPDVLVIGIGKSEMMEVKESVLSVLEEKNIELVYFKTAKAIEFYNEKLKKNKKIVGLFHLTC